MAGWDDRSGAQTTPSVHAGRRNLAPRSFSPDAGSRRARRSWQHLSVRYPSPHEPRAGMADKDGFSLAFSIAFLHIRERVFTIARDAP